MSKKTNEKGFTIIEVVLVLAIAGLIFLIVFLALPQLQSSRRDTQRRNDTGRLLAALESWAGNHSGSYPAESELDSGDGSDWVDANIAGDFRDPSGDAYSFQDSYNDVEEPGDIKYELGAVCNDNSDGTTGGDPRDVAVVMQLENGQYCQDNR